MATTNAFDLLILPMLQWTVGTYAAFALFGLVQVGFRRLVGTTERRPTVDLARGSEILDGHRRASNRPERARLRVVGVPR